MRNKAFWLSFILDRYARERQVLLANVFPTLQRSGALAFLDEQYETVHLENPFYVYEDIDRFLERAGETLG